MKKDNLLDKVEIGQTVYGISRYTFSSDKLHLREHTVTRKNKTSFYLDLGEECELRVDKWGYVEHVMYGISEHVYLTEEDRQQYIDEVDKRKKQDEFLQDRLKHMDEEDLQKLYTYFSEKYGVE